MLVVFQPKNLSRVTAASAKCVKTERVYLLFILTQQSASLFLAQEGKESVTIISNYSTYSNFKHLLILNLCKSIKS